MPKSCLWIVHAPGGQFAVYRHGPFQSRRRRTLRKWNRRWNAHLRTMSKRCRDKHDLLMGLIEYCDKRFTARDIVELAYGVTNA
jgi:hypothetical protein